MLKKNILTIAASWLLITNISPVINTSNFVTPVNAEESTSSALTSESLPQHDLPHSEMRNNESISEESAEREVTAISEETSTSESNSDELKNNESEEISTSEKEIETTQTTEETTEVTEEETSDTAMAPAGVAEVASWDEFKQAVRNESITKIVLTKSFDNPSGSDFSFSSYSRKNNLEIDGQGNRVDFKNSSIKLGSPSSESGNFHMHDIILNQRYGGAESEDIVGTRLNYTSGGKWRYRFGNIKTEPGVQRLARASHSEVTLYGTMDLDTRAENFYLGSLKMEDGTQYKGNVNFYNFSIFWYNVEASSNSTGASKEFTIGKDCRVDLTQSQTSGTTYPAVYSYYQALTVGENSTFNVNMPGNAVRFDMNGSGMRVKSGAVVNLTSKQNSGSVVSYSNDNTYLIVDPKAYFYTIGRSNEPLINLSANGLGTGDWSRHNNKLVLNSPAQYDIRNLRDGYTAVQVASGSNSSNNFQILDADIDLWKLSTKPLGPSDEAYSKVSFFAVSGNGSSETVKTSAEGLRQFSQRAYRRISGMNQNPVVEWTPVTDADKSAKVRVIIGYVPDNNGLDAEGKINYIPVYASKDQAFVTVTDTHGEVKKNLPTDADGYAYYKTDKFNLAGKDMSAVAQRGPWSSEEEAKYKVIDVTPPEPAVVDGGNTQPPNIKALSGTGEAGAIVTLTLNGIKQNGITTRIDSKGKWTLSLGNLSLKKDDVLQLFLQDTSGKVTQIPDPPKTNNNVGNIQPDKDYAYRDAVFKSAVKILIIGTLELTSVPEKIDFGTQKVSNVQKEYRPSVTGDLVISDTRGNEKQTWRLSIKESKPLTSDKNDFSGLLYYTNSKETLNIGKDYVVVEERKLTEDGSIDLSKEWNREKGLSLRVPVEKQRIGKYDGTLSWTLEDVPGNE